MLSRLFILGCVVFLSLGSQVKAEDHTETKTDSSGTRSTNGFADYDTLSSKLESWAGKIGLSSREEKEESGVSKVFLTQSESNDAAKWLKRIKWYRSAIADSCESSDASSKEFSSALDECLAPGFLFKAVQDAKQSGDRWEISTKVQDMVNCKEKIAEYFSAKKSMVSDSDKYKIDWELSEKISKTFDLFIPKNTSVKAVESGKLAESVKAMNPGNLCEVQEAKPSVAEAAKAALKPEQKVEAASKTTPPETQKQGQQAAAKTGYEKAPEQAAKKNDGYEKGGEGYEKSDYSYDKGKYNYDPSQYNYDPSKYNYDPSRYQYDPNRGYDSGLGAYAGLMNGLYQPQDYPQQQPYPQNNNFPPQFPPQDGGGGNSSGPYPPQPYPQQPQRPYSQMPFFFPPPPPAPLPPIIGGGIGLGIGFGSSNPPPRVCTTGCSVGSNLNPQLLALLNNPLMKRPCPQQPKQMCPVQLPSNLLGMMPGMSGMPGMPMPYGNMLPGQRPVNQPGRVQVNPYPTPRFPYRPQPQVFPRRPLPVAPRAPISFPSR